MGGGNHLPKVILTVTHGLWRVHADIQARTHAHIFINFLKKVYSLSLIEWSGYKR